MCYELMASARKIRQTTKRKERRETQKEKKKK
jgi:hypothetical protein